jgi:hypothetical protein
MKCYDDLMKKNEKKREKYEAALRIASNPLIALLSSFIHQKMLLEFFESSFWRVWSLKMGFWRS